MSQTTDFYMSWLANNAFGGSGVRIRDQEPIVFQPTDISGLAMWLDGNDNDAVVYNDLLLVSAWKNKGYLGGQFNFGGGVIQYGQTLVNGLNTVTFNSNAYMAGTFALDFQARSVFFVTKENTALSGGTPNPWFTSDTTGGMETFSLRNGAFTYFLGKHPSPIPELAFETNTDYLGVPTMVEFINGTDLLDNWFGINGAKYPPIYDAVASGYNTGSITYYLGGYFGGSTVATNQDICEVLIYNKALTDADRINVESYLRRKWNLAEPPPVPPGPFSPPDIAGLQLWMDATQGVTVDPINSNVTSWSNQGSVIGVFNAGCNLVYPYTNKNGQTYIEFPSQTTLEGNMSFPYLTRTAFCVWQNLSQFELLGYPYQNMLNTGTFGGRQFGLAYDSNASNYALVLCQQGLNCPALTTLSFGDVGVGDTYLAIWQCASNTTSNNAVYFNGGSNINTSADLGNLFNTGIIDYSMGSPVVDSPSYRVGEMIEYDSILDAGQLSTVATYLATKWAISSFVPLS